MTNRTRPGQQQGRQMMRFLDLQLEAEHGKKPANKVKAQNSEFGKSGVPMNNGFRPHGGCRGESCLCTGMHIELFQLVVVTFTLACDSKVFNLIEC